MLQGIPPCGQVARAVLLLFILWTSGCVSPLQPGTPSNDESSDQGSSGQPEPPPKPEPEQEHELKCASAPRLGPGASEFTIETLAGSGPPDLGDGGPAKQATLEKPYDLAVAGEQIYVVDHENHRVRLIDSDGIIHTVAGTGSAETQGLGDGGLATDATLRLPRGLTLASDGSFYIGDTNHYVVRRVDPQGIITTVAGTRSFTYSGDGGPALEAGFGYPWGVAVADDGQIYIADAGANRVRRVDTEGVITTIAGNGEAGSSGDGGPATMASLNHPADLAFDQSGRLLIAGSGVSSLRRVDLVTGTIATVPGTEGVFAVTVDAGNNIYFTTHSQVKRVDARTQSVVVVAGSERGFGGDGGPATEANFRDLRGVAVTPGGDILVSDSGNNRVRRISGGQVETIAGTGEHPGDDAPANEAAIYDSQGLAWDAQGNLFFSDFPHHLIRRLDCDGQVTTVAGTRQRGTAGDGGSPLAASFSNPSALTFDGHGQLLFIDQDNGVGVVRLITPGPDGVINGDEDERIITVAGSGAPRSEADHGSADGGPARAAAFMGVRGIAVDSMNRLYVGDFLDNRVRVVSPGADGILNGKADEIIQTMAGDGQDTQSGDGMPATQASLGGALWLSVDGANNIYVSTDGNGEPRRIRMVNSSSGFISTLLEPQTLTSFEADSSGILYLADGKRIIRFDPGDSTQDVVAGTGQPGLAGDGGDAEAALFRGAGFLAISPDGRIALADNGNYRLRILLPAENA